MKEPQILHRGKVSDWLKVLFTGRKRGPVDEALLQKAQEKRGRRAARNLRWWAGDSNWHKQCLARAGER